VTGYVVNQHTLSVRRVVGCAMHGEIDIGFVICIC
jgi:hypothetical protein